MRRLVCVVSLLAVLCASTPAVAQTAIPASETAFIQKIQSAVALLYSQDENGNMRMRCTATIYERIPKGYRFVSAAHCVGSDRREKEWSADADEVPFFITFDESATKRFWPAEAVFVGYQSRGEDFAVFEVATTETWPIIPLGNEQQEVVPAPYWNVASPLGLGKQVFSGSITSLDLDRPVKQNDINWQHSLVLQQAGVNGGSSGSALVSRSQQAIIGFLVGTIGESTIVAIPVSRFKLALKAWGDKKYPWFHPKVVLQ